MKKGLSIVINLILFAIIMLLVWQVVKSIQAPIKFTHEQKTREAKVIERLIDIRNAEVLYKNATNKYTDNFDTLIKFCKAAEIPVVKMVSKQNLEDSTYFTVYDTIGFVKVMDSLKAGREDFNIDEIKWVPFSEPKQQFELEAGSKNSSLVEIPIFEARTPFEVYLGTPGGGIGEKEWKQRVDNAREEKVSASRDSRGEVDVDSPYYRYPGLKVGSMKEASTEGNWDKL